jgi:hypothetical protein
VSRRRRHPSPPGLAAAAAALLVLAACGGNANPHSQTSPASTTTKARPESSAVAELAGAEHPLTGQFPSAAGRSLRQLAALVSSTAQFSAANGTFTPGPSRRLVFALTDPAQHFIYAPTAIYLAPSPGAPAAGPFLAPADPMTVAPQYRSAQNSAPGGLKAVYWTNVPAPHPRVYDLLAVTRTPMGLIGATGEIAVAASSPIPDVGSRPPAIATDTLASVHGKVSLLTTRLPPETMHSVSFNQVLGKEPVALLFSTPQLCMSRICGPVTDVTVALAHEFGHRIVFIHQEVYVDNQPTKGLRPQLKAFHLETEPWLFAVNRRGVIAARLEGAFGTNELRRALQAALS